MKIRIAVLAALVALVPCAALADFVEGSAVVNYRVSQVTPYTYDATAAGVSDYADLSSCGGGVTATFSQSVEDTSTDALVEIRACATASSEWQDCTLLRVGPDQLPDGVAVSIGNFPSSRPYALLRFPVGPSGGDTARVVLDCTEETTTTDGGSGTPDDDSVTTAKIVDGTILPADIDTSPTGISWGAFNMVDSLGAVLNAGVVDTTSLGNGAVSVAKMYSSATDRLFGRDTAAAGQGQEITVGGGLEFTGSAGIQRSALTGDVTASAGSGTTAIATGVIVDADVNASAAIAGTKLANTPAGGVSATTVQAAIDELDTEKANTADILTASQVFRTDADSAADDGTLSDWSAVNASDNNEGVKLPQAAAPAQTGEGLIAWDSDDDLLKIGDGAATDTIGSAPFFETFGVGNIDPDASFDGLCLKKGDGGTATPALTACMASNTARTHAIYKASGAIGWVSKLVCEIDAVTSSEASDVIEVEVVEDVVGGATPTVIASMTFTGTSEIASNFLKGATINLPWSSAETALGLRVQWTDADAGGETSGLYLQCVLSGWM